MLRVGMIGCGRVAETRHLPVLRGLPNAEVVALADVDRERLMRIGSLFGVEQRYGDYRRLLEDRRVDVVAVCVPVALHAEVALAALEAGKHVFVEKPLALDLDECDVLIDQAAHSPGRVMVGFNMRWHPLVLRAKQSIDSGELGTIELMRSVFTSDLRHGRSVPEWRNQRALGGGVLFDLAVHHFDLWRFLLGSEVSEVIARSSSGDWPDQRATVLGHMASGIWASSVFSELTSASNEFEVYGRDRRLRLDCYQFDGFSVLPAWVAPGSLASRVRRTAEIARELAHLRGALRGGPWLEAWRAEWRHFFHAIASGTTARPTFEDGRRALQVVLAAVESASSRRPVKVAEAPRSVARMEHATGLK
jgi:myo-inositol 2-dehydrogenase/D-chiro-inositol 1-dehydrogenase